MNPAWTANLLEFLQTALLWYVGMMILVYFGSNALIYHPPKSTYQDGPKIIKLNSGRKQISAIYLNNINSKYTLLFSHGNAEDLGGVYPFLNALYEQGYSVLGYDYQGYGTSEGSPSEGNTYSDISAAYHYLTDVEKISPERIIVFGRSLGSGPSVELASSFPVGGLILEAPFVTAFRVMTRIPLFPVDKYRNIAKIRHVKVPILIMHGTQDEVIPFWHGKLLSTLTQKPVQFYSIEGGHHNDLVLIAGSAYWDMINQYIKSLNNDNGINQHALPL
ncbi:MAG: alpha/beta hydrolase [Gammaproteobacteria bacterium]